MSDETALLKTLVRRPDEAGQVWLVLADLLEEAGDPRFELIRLRHHPDWRPELDRPARERRLVELLLAGVKPCVPTFVNKAGMTFVWCPPGTFLMGCTGSEPGCPTEDWQSDQRQHAVTLTRGFWAGAYQVTQAQYRRVLRRKPSGFKGDDRPVERVSWHQAVEFCERLSAREKRPYRLLTEAEWEYACRAGTTTPYWFGETIDTALANSVPGQPGSGGDRSGGRTETMPVGSFFPNPWGLYDTHGNVWEWCSDWYARFPEGPATDPAGPEAGENKMCRGGSWGTYPNDCRSSARNHVCSPNDRYDFIGFRVALSADDLP